MCDEAGDGRMRMRMGIVMEDGVNEAGRGSCLARLGQGEVRKRVRTTEGKVAK